MLALRALSLIVALLMVVSACSSDSDSSTEDPDPSPTAEGSDTTEEPGVDIDESELIVPDVSADDDLATQLLGKFFGLSGDFITADQRACVSEEMLAVFPDGVIPEDRVFDEEIADAMNAAGETCGVTNLS